MKPKMLLLLSFITFNLFAQNDYIVKGLMYVGEGSKVSFKKGVYMEGDLFNDGSIYVHDNFSGDPSFLKSGSNSLVSLESDTIMNIAQKYMFNILQVNANKLLVEKNLSINELRVEMDKELIVNRGNILRIYKKIENKGDLILKADEMGYSEMITGKNGNGLEVNSGNITIEKYIAGKKNADGVNQQFRFMGSPVKGTIFGQYTRNGTFFDNNIASVFEWKGAKRNILQAWEIKGTDDIVETGRSYLMRFGNNISDKERFSLTSLSSVISHRGLANDGDINVELLDVDEVDAVESRKGWYLISNPYPFSIDWNKLYELNKDVMEPVVYTLNDNKMGYRVIAKNSEDAILFLNAPEGHIIKPFEGIIIRKKERASSNIIKFTNDMNYYDVNEDKVMVKSENKNANGLKIRLYNEKTTQYYDTYINFSNYATDEFDKGMDAKYMGYNSVFDVSGFGVEINDLYSKDKNGNKYAINQLSQLNPDVDEHIIPLGIQSSAKEEIEYFLEVDLMELNIDSSWNIFIRDNVLNKDYDVKKGEVFSVDNQEIYNEGDKYRFKFKNGDMENRFSIVFTKYNLQTAENAIMDDEESDQVLAFANQDGIHVSINVETDAQSEISIVNSLGQVLHRGMVTSNETLSYKPNQVKNQVFFVHIKMNGKLTVKKVMY